MGPEPSPASSSSPRGERLSATPPPPEYAWDWFARQRLLWREVRQRLSDGAGAAAARYSAAETKGEVLTLLKADYGRDEQVCREVRAAVARLAFLGRTHVPFEQLGVPHPPRGLRWWWTALTGERLAMTPPRSEAGQSRGPVQLSLDEIQQGLGG